MILFIVLAIDSHNCKVMTVPHKLNNLFNENSDLFQKSAFPILFLLCQKRLGLEFI